MSRQAVVTKPVDSPKSGSAIFLALIGYLVLSLRQPPAWTMPVWIALAFVLVPAAIGLTVSRVSLVRAGARAAGFVAFNLMFLYTALNLIRTHLKVASGTDAGQVFFVGVVVCIIYAVMAGLVAGGVYTLRGGRAKG